MWRSCFGPGEPHQLSYASEWCVKPILLVCNKRDDTMSFVNPVTIRIAKIILLATNLHDILLTPDHIGEGPPLFRSETNLCFDQLASREGVRREKENRNLRRGLLLGRGSGVPKGQGSDGEHRRL